MLSISNFKDKLVNLINNQEEKVAKTQTEGESKQSEIASDSKDATVILMADNIDIELDFDDRIKRPASQKEVVAVYGDNKDIQGSSGNQQVIVVGEKNKINSGNGNDDILALGNNNDINSGNGNNTVVFKGNNLNITTGTGNDNIASLEFAIMQENGEYPDYSKFDNFLKVTNRDVKGELLNEESYTKELSRTVDVKNTVNGTSGSDLLAKLSPEARKIAESLDLNEKVPGTDLPKYIIAQGSASGGKWHIYTYVSGNGDHINYTAFGESVSSKGDKNLHLSKNNITNNNNKLENVETTTVTTVTQDYTKRTYADYTETTIAGNKNITINDAGGNNNISVNADKVKVNADNGNNNINILDGLILKDNYREYEKETKNGKAKTDVRTTEVSSTYNGGNIYSTAVKAYDPIIVDFNRDGKVSAAQGQGVDINGDGIADGTAARGDKMLAMNDINGSGAIDGGEVFGDQTVSPFTGEKLNAANGFEALAKVAKEAEQYTGIKCLDSEGNVNLAELKRALNKVGVNIGFISESNVTSLEDLAHVASINVANYLDIDGANLQTSYYTDNTGAKYEASDIWFKSKQ